MRSKVETGGNGIGGKNWSIVKKEDEIGHEEI